MIARRAAATLAVAATAVFGAAWPTGSTAAAGPEAAQEQARRTDRATGVLVRWAPGADREQRAAAVRRVGLTRGRALSLPRTELIDVAQGRAELTAARLAADPAVAHAEPDAPLYPSAPDPGFPLLWGLHNEGQDGGVVDVDIDAPEAWASASFDRTVTVAVIDEGIDLAHPDLAGVAWRNPDEVAGNGVDDDGNGYVDDVHGWDFANRDASVYDVADGDEHGTHVAGIIGAEADNGTGVRGVAPNVSIMALKFLAPEIGGSTSDAIEAIEYARDNGADVINASWGGPVASSLLRQAIAASGLLFVAASGNGGPDGVGDDAAHEPEFPAAFRLPNLVSVAAVDRTGALASYSNFGSTAIHLGAPGHDVVSTIPGNRYASISGTSMATPYVTGTGAMLASLAPELSGVDLAALLTSTAVRLPALGGRTATGGMVNAAAAVARLSSSGAPAQLGACPPTVAASRFSDVAAGSTHQANIDCVAWWGLASGVGGGQYAPVRQVTRAQMASFLAGVVRATGLLPAATRDRFIDDDGAVHEPAINAMAELGIVRGTGDGSSYRPGDVVTRAQMATFLVNLQEFITGRPMATGPTRFTDAGGVHGTSIAKAYTAGLTSGVNATTFGAGLPVRRDQMASFLANELGVLVAARQLAPLS